jgi:hypothetical protein
MKQSIIIISLLLIITTSCINRKDGKETGHGPYSFSIEIPKTLENSSMTNADSVFSSVEYIPLETRPDAIMGDALRAKLKIDDDMVYILDRGNSSAQKIMIFHVDGRLFDIIDKQGRGPGEYVKAVDFTIENGIIYILATGNEKILKYDINKGFLGDITLPFVATAIAKVDDYFFLHTRVTISGGKFGIHVIDNKGTIVNQFYEFDELSFAHNQQQVLWRFNDTVYAEFHHDYNVFQMTSDYFKTYATFDFGEDNMTPEVKSLSNYTHNLQITNYLHERSYRPPKGLDYVLVNDDFLIVQFTSFFLKRTIIWNKTSGEIIDKPVLSSKRFPVIQGIDYNALVGNRLYTLVPAERITKARDGGFGEFPESIEALRAEDNPVLVIYTIKQ